MIAFGLDAALGAFTAAIVRDGQTLAAIELPGNVALEQGLTAVRTVIAQAGITPPEIDRLGVGIGPGSFTGVRIAISYAKSLAQGWRLPLAGISSFDALEAGIDSASILPLLTVVRGRQGVVSVRLRMGNGEQRASGYTADVIAELGESLGGAVNVLGDAEDVLAALGERGVDVQIRSRVLEPTALAVATLAAQREPARSSHEIRADYGELPAARVPKHIGPISSP